MTNYKKYFLSILLLKSLCFSDSGYNTIYLMEFDNLKNDFAYSHLKQALPDLIRENYSFRQDIKIEYAENIRPNIEKYKTSAVDSIKGFIINGRFETINNEFYIEFEAYDIHNWNQLVKRRIFCPLHDLFCVHDAFLISIESSISPFLLDKLDIDATISALDLGKKQTQSYTLEKETKYDHEIIRNNIKQFDSQNELDSQYDNQGNKRTQYYREFNLKKLIPHNIPENEKNTQKLVEILEHILQSPYDVIIGKIQLTSEPDNSEMISVELPIQYSMMRLLSHELLMNITHKKYLNENDNVIIQFSNNDFIFDNILMEKLALTRFQIMPVIFLSNNIGNTQLIILDSWSNKNNKYNSSNITVLFEKQFKPLFSLTQGIDIVQLTISPGTLNVVYRFSIPYEKLGDYTKVTVKFMQENELEKLLDNSYDGGVN